MDLQPDRFDYDFTNIFRSTQDLDVVVDAPADVALRFRNILANRYPHFLGSKASWEVRPLRHRLGTPGEPGFKEALLDDADFSLQNTDSNSIGMVEITRSNEPIVRDLRHWDEPQSLFLQDAVRDRISFLRSPRHFETSRARMGENPEILSVIRLLVKAFQYELGFSKADFETLKSIADAFDPHQVANPNARRRILDTAKKLVIHATDIEYGMNQLDALGLRRKLISMGDPKIVGDPAWWLNREPLRSFPVGQGSGETARELGIDLVAHTTRDFLALESITRSHSGRPNVLTSRKDAVGEAAAHGEGFYTQKGRRGGKFTGFTIRYETDPRAREGTDFTRHENYVIFHNKNALRVIQESLNFSWDDVVQLAEDPKQFLGDDTDRGLVERLKRKISAMPARIDIPQLVHSSSAADQERLVQILSALQDPVVSQLFTRESSTSIANAAYAEVKALAKADGSTPTGSAQLLHHIQIAGAALPVQRLADGAENRDFIRLLETVTRSKELPFELRKEAALELILNPQRAQHQTDFEVPFAGNELRKVRDEIRSWDQSTDLRKRHFTRNSHLLWEKSLEAGESPSRWLGTFLLNPIPRSSRELVRSLIEIRDLPVLRSLARYHFARPGTQNQEDLILRLALIGDREIRKNLARYAFSQPHYAGKNALIREFTQHSREAWDILAQYTLSQPHGSRLIDSIKIIVEKGHTLDLQALAQYTFSQPYAVKIKPLIRRVIERGDLSTIQYIALYTLGQPAAREMVDLVPFLIRHHPENSTALAYLASSGSHWSKGAGAESALRLLIESGGPRVHWALAEHVFSQPHTQEMYALVELLIRKKDPRVLCNLAHYTFSQPHASPMKGLMLMALERREWAVLERFARYVFSQPHSVQLTDVLRVVVESAQRDANRFLRESLAMPHWADPKYASYREAIEIEDLAERGRFLEFKLGPALR